MEYKNSDKILGVSKNAEDKTTERADRQFARQYRPDRNPGGIKSEATFEAIGETYKDLSAGIYLDYGAARLTGREQVPTLDSNPLARSTIS